ncbi:MAG: histone deacetylase [Myxococcota bacterium]
MTPPLLIRDSRFLEHRPARPHPERPERLQAIDEALRDLKTPHAQAPAREASDEEILRVHSAEALGQLQALSGTQAQLDADTYVSPRSTDVARLAAGGSADLVLRVAGGENRSGFALVRPPGHHAERDRAMGFCLLNNAAIAVEALRHEAGLERVAILDWDVHHGNGTQHLFEADRDVLYVSLHQFPFYPGTGSLEERGTGAGEGATLNLPLPAGCGDAEYGAAFERIVLPVLEEFVPELVVVSAGFDAHFRDPLASMEITEAGYARMTADLVALCEALCGGRLVLILEGGYDGDALGASVRTVVEQLAPEADPPPDLPGCSEVESHFLDRIRSAHAEHWRSLRSTRSH